MTQQAALANINRLERAAHRLSHTGDRQAWQVDGSTMTRQVHAHYGQMLLELPGYRLEVVQAAEQAMQNDQFGTLNIGFTSTVEMQMIHVLAQKWRAWVTLRHQLSGSCIVYPDVEHRVARLIADYDVSRLAGRRIGLEKESLRVNAAGEITQTDHPEALGSALCNGVVTTDFSEALLEMVTPPCASAREAMDYLSGIHQFILPRLPEGEHLWNTSMPCILRGEQSIRIGNYGTSHNGRMKHAYRRGLGIRYGRRMQAIAGVHFNFSLPLDSWSIWQSLQETTLRQAANASHQANKRSVSADAAQQGGCCSLVTRGYFHMTRNLLRTGWLIPYLFGASPAICQSFLPPGAVLDLHTFNETTRFAPFGTSLRMGDIGYQYRQDGALDLSVRHDDFKRYLDDLLGHVTTEHPAYRELGIKDAQGEYQQLNARRLQIENEYYSSVRPKQIPESGEMPILAMQRRGIRYLELRAIDVNLFDPVGVHVEQIAMLEMLMLFAWLADSPALTQSEMVKAGNNMRAVAQRGRYAGLTLQRPAGDTTLADWGLCIVDALQPLATWLDSAQAEPLYERSLDLQRAKLENADLTPSARQLAGLREHGSFFEYALAQSREHHSTLLAASTDDALQSELAAVVDRSRRQQAQMEADTTRDFDTFLHDYFSQLDDSQNQVQASVGCQ